MRKLRKNLEQGQATLVFGLFLIALLAVFAWVIFDLGRIGLGVVRARNVLDMAAYSAANQIDQPTFNRTQHLVLDAAAEPAFRHAVEARSRLGEGMTLVVDHVEFFNGRGYMRVQATVKIPLGSIGMFGASSVEQQITTVVEPRYGLQNVFD